MARLRLDSAARALEIRMHVHRSQLLGPTNSGSVRLTLTEPNERKRSQQKIVDMVNRNLNKYSDGKAFAIQEQTISVNRRAGLPVQFVIQNNDFDKIAAVLPKFLEEANKSPVFQGVDVDLPAAVHGQALAVGAE